MENVNSNANFRAKTGKLTIQQLFLQLMKADSGTIHKLI